MTSTLDIALANTETAFHALAQPWNDLVKQCEGSLFLRYEWFDAAWAWRKENAQLFILVAHAGTQVVGILPLIQTSNSQKFPRLRALEFLTVPDTQMCDLIVDQEHRASVVDAFCDELHRRRNTWDLLTLSYTAENSIVLHDFKRALQMRHYLPKVADQGPNLYVKLNTSWESYYGERSRSLKKANNLAANRLKKTGQIDIQWVFREQAADAATQNALTQAIDISRRSWKQDTGNSLDQAGPNRFISTLTGHAARNGWLSLWLLSIDGRALAMEYQLLDQGNVYALRADFDASCEEISPGSHLMRTLLETLFGQGLNKYYMGPGDNAYKTRWTEECDMLYRLTTYGATWRGKVGSLVNDTLKPVARTIRDKISRQPGK